MIRSRYGNRQYIYSDKWCVSVINYNSGYIFGHSLICVEGISCDNNIFVNYYEIKASMLQESTCFCFSINLYGVISDVRIRENVEYDMRYDKCRTKCFSSIHRDKVISMIESIKLDKYTTLNYNSTGNNPIKFQLVGNNTILSDIDKGNNCAGWCIEKLSILDVCDNSGKTIPFKLVMF